MLLRRPTSFHPRIGAGEPPQAPSNSSSMAGTGKNLMVWHQETERAGMGEWARLLPCYGRRRGRRTREPPTATDNDGRSKDQDQAQRRLVA